MREGINKVLPDYLNFGFIMNRTMDQDMKGKHIGGTPGPGPRPTQLRDR